MNFYFIVNDYYFFRDNFSFLINKVNFKHQNTILFSKNIKAASIKNQDSNVITENLLFNKNKLKLVELIRTWIQLFWLILKNKDSVFTSITIIPIILSGFFLRILKRRCVFILTGFGSIFISNALIYRYLRYFINFCFKFFFKNDQSFIIVQNNDDRKYLVNKLNITANRVIVILGCGRSADSFPYLKKLKDHGFPKIYVPARLIKDKGIEDIALASQELTNKGLNHEFIFTFGITKGNPKSYSEEDITQLKSKYPSLKFLGFQKDVRDVYKECNIVCLPSYREGLPGALLEASAMGIPIITTNTPGCREIVTQKTTGLLVEPKNPIQIAQAIIELNNNKELSEKVRVNAYKQFLNKYASTKIINEYASFYDKFN